MNKSDIIKTLALEPHPEGGFFKETYRSEEIIPESALDNKYGGLRNVSTAIYFLIDSDNFSAFHKINQDEFWHFHLGSPIKLHQISPLGEYTTVIIGNHLLEGHIPQYVVPAGYWFAAEVLENEAYALVGCTVAPGFDFADFTLAKRNELVELFPEHTDAIKKLTRI